MGKRKRIGAFVGNVHTYFPSKIVSSIYNECLTKNVDVLFFLGLENAQFLGKDEGSLSNTDYQYRTVYDYASLMALDAVVVNYGTITTFHDIDPDKFYGMFGGIPCVSISDEIDKKWGVSVQNDNYTGVKQCMNHLINRHGLKKILFLSGPASTNRNAKDRLNAYLDSMKNHGFEVKDDMVAYGNYMEYVDDLVEELLDKNGIPEAVAVANDQMTRAVYRVLKKRGIAVGKDVAVTGFDDIDSAAYSDPPLTTVRQDASELTHEAMKLVFDMLDGREVQNVMLPTQFVCRGSCGCKFRLKSNNEIGLDEKEIDDFVHQYDEMRISWHRTLAGPFLIKELISLAGDQSEFFSHACRVLSLHGSKNSCILMLPNTAVIKSADEWEIPKKLHLKAVQKGDKIEVYENPAQWSMESDEDLFGLDDVKETRAFFNFLLFDGERNYGIMAVQITPEQISDFYMISIQLGTAMHFLELTMQQVQYRQQLQEQNDILNFSALSDELTGVLNRRGIFERTYEYLSGHDGEHMIALMMDLDHLKEINDSFGHTEGDFALCEAAILIHNALGDDGFVGRYGGDEFFAIIPVESKDAGELLMASICSKLKNLAHEFNSTSTKPYYVELSVGTASWVANEGIDFAGLIARVDKLLYEAKKKRRSSIRKVQIVA